MNITQVQRLLAHAGLYGGLIDGVAGPKTMSAVGLLLNGMGRGWPDLRKLIAAAQMILNSMNFEAGVVDGYDGHNTSNAYSQWQYFDKHGKRELVSRNAIKSYKPKDAADLSEIPLQSQVNQLYGDPETQVPNRLVTVTLPFPLRLDYALDTLITRVTLHELCVDSFIAAMIDVRAHYGDKRMRELGLDRFAGGYMKRLMRGGKKWSMHALGCAVDFFARPNGLKTRCPKALFCGPDYKAFLDIMEAHGWLSAVRMWGADAMHFQQARLRR